MQEKSDAELLREYADQTNEAAFREIVTRHADLVYASALRQVRSPELARDIAQSVFADLVRKAPSLGQTLAENASLVGWLYRSTRFAAHKQLRNDRRRKVRERQAMENFNSTSETATEWEEIGPVLDEAMADLSDEDREALLLRYFKNHDFRTIGVALGVSDDAAQKRVSRALERLRAEFHRRGVTTTGVALAAAVSANAVTVGPAGLAAALSTAALSGTALTTTATATQAIAMTTLQKVLVVAVAILAGVGIYEARKASQLRDQIRAFEQRQTPLTEQIGQLQSQRDDAMQQLAALRDENERLNRSITELPKLRSEVTRLRKDIQEKAKLEAPVPQKTSNLDSVAQIILQNIGPSRAGEEQVRTNIHIRIGDTFSRTNIDLDVRNLYESGLFSNVRVIDRKTDEGVILTYLLQEKPKLTGIHFEGSTKYTEAELMKTLTGKIGEPFDERKLFNDSQKLQKLYVAAGYPDTQVKYVMNVDESAGEGVVTYKITE